MKILLFRGRGLISALIRWQTQGKYSHVAVQLDGGSIIESWPGVGVHAMDTLKHGDADIDFYSVIGLTSVQHNAVEDFLWSQVSKRYDYIGCLRFLRHFGWMPRSFSRWFCSDLVAKAFDFAGVPLLNNVPYYRVSPVMVGYSTRLTLCTR